MSKVLFRYFYLLILLGLLSGCGWKATLDAADGTPVTVTRATLRDLKDFADEEGRVPVERMLYQNGYRLIETLHVTDAEGGVRALDWAASAETLLWLESGKLLLGDETLAATHLAVSPAPELAEVAVSLTDIAPTAAAALGIPVPAQATGRALTAAPAQHVVLIFLDGFGYLRYLSARDVGLVPHLSALGEPQMGLSVYPPCTAVGSAAVLTGAPPEVNGVVQRGIRTTESETLPDVAVAAGLRVVAVEGDALAFNMRNADLTLSGDRDGNGSTDDNVRANALAALAEGLPDVLWVHFHGIDDVGHTYGPDTPEDSAAIAGVDAVVGDLLAALPSETLVIIFADHGMHAVQEEGRLGNHGNLIARDMLVPVWVVQQ
ncbi:MAG TPA: alkaline phosphatase family protein [Anaerolineae bacterium]|nr:alkaline phosphatase family protein [Anaerolineae bacterium]